MLNEAFLERGTIAKTLVMNWYVIVSCYTKALLKQIGALTFVLTTNLIFNKVFEPFWVQCTWGLLCLWIFFDSIVLCQDIRVLESNYDIIRQAYSKETSYQADINKRIFQIEKKHTDAIKDMRKTMESHFQYIEHCLEQNYSNPTDGKGKRHFDVNNSSEGERSLIHSTYVEKCIKRKQMTKQSSFDDLYVGTNNEKIYVFSLDREKDSLKNIHSFSLRNLLNKSKQDL